MIFLALGRGLPHGPPKGDHGVNPLPSFKVLLGPYQVFVKYIASNAKYIYAPFYLSLLEPKVKADFVTWP